MDNYSHYRKAILRPQLLNWGVQNPTSRLSHTSICLYGLHNGWMGKKSLNLAFESAKTKAANTQSFWLAPGKIRWISKIKLSSIVHLLIVEFFLHHNWPFYKICYRESDVLLWWQSLWNQVINKALITQKWLQTIISMHEQNINSSLQQLISSTRLLSITKELKENPKKSSSHKVKRQTHQNMADH